MKKCPKHDCKMVVVKLGVGWGNESEYECPECKKEEQARSAGRDANGFSTAKAGWQ